MFLLNRYGRIGFLMGHNDYWLGLCVGYCLKACYDRQTFNKFRFIPFLVLWGISIACNFFLFDNKNICLHSKSLFRYVLSNNNANNQDPTS